MNANKFAIGRTGMERPIAMMSLTGVFMDRLFFEAVNCCTRMYDSKQHF